MPEPVVHPRLSLSIRFWRVHAPPADCLAPVAVACLQGGDGQGRHRLGGGEDGGGGQGCGQRRGGGIEGGA
ncbi:hypothetical protein DRW03_10975 [Corallococcus sp. H22C18031201]|nr:hypothetical protein DRW03_10975 [Corallococcus sp. H22C18031201]